MTRKTLAARKEVISRFKERIESTPGFKLPDVASEIADELIADADFVAAHVGEIIASFVYEVGMAFVHSGRSGSIAFRDGSVVTTAALQDPDSARRSIFDTWYERVDDEYVALKTMTAEMLETAAIAREQQIAELQPYPRFLRLVAKRLKGSQVAGDLTDAVLQRLHHEAQATTQPTGGKDGNLRRNGGRPVRRVQGQAALSGKAVGRNTGKPGSNRSLAKKQVSRVGRGKKAARAGNSP